MIKKLLLILSFLGMVHLNYCSQNPNLAQEIAQISTFLQCFSTDENPLSTIGLAMDYVYDKYADNYPQEVNLYLYSKNNQHDRSNNYGDSALNWDDIIQKGSSLQFKLQEGSPDQWNFCINNYNIGTFPKKTISWCNKIALYYYMPCENHNYDKFLNELPQYNGRSIQEIEKESLQHKKANNPLKIMLAINIERDKNIRLRIDQKWIKDRDSNKPKQVKWLTITIMQQKLNLAIPVPPIRYDFVSDKLQLQRELEKLQDDQNQKIEALRTEAQKLEELYQKKMKEIQDLLSSKSNAQTAVNIQRYQPNNYTYSQLSTAEKALDRATKALVDEQENMKKIVQEIETNKNNQTELEKAFKQKHQELQSKIDTASNTVQSQPIKELEKKSDENKLLDLQNKLKILEQQYDESINALKFPVFYNEKLLSLDNQKKYCNRMIFLYTTTIQQKPEAADDTNKKLQEQQDKLNKINAEITEVEQKQLNAKQEHKQFIATRQRLTDTFKKEKQKLELEIRNASETRPTSTTPTNNTQKQSFAWFTKPSSSTIVVSLATLIGILLLINKYYPLMNMNLQFSQQG